MNRRITVEMGRTISTGNFESKKIMVGISKDIPDNVDIDEAFDKIMDKLEERLDEEEAGILEDVINK